MATCKGGSWGSLPCVQNVDYTSFDHVPFVSFRIFPRCSWIFLDFRVWQILKVQTWGDQSVDLVWWIDGLIINGLSIYMCIYIYMWYSYVYIYIYIIEYPYPASFSFHDEKKSTGCFSGDFHWFPMDDNPKYIGLMTCPIEKWWFSIVMLNYQRVPLLTTNSSSIQVSTSSCPTTCTLTCEAQRGNPEHQWGGLPIPPKTNKKISITCF